MLTPKEVSERAFTRASFGGYNMAMVDEFLDILTEDYTALYNENAVLKSKMKVLVDKVEEYRTTEDAMRKALMSAQSMADKLVQEAQDKKASILRQAEQSANDQIAQIRRQLEAEQARLAAAQQATAAYVQQVRQLQEKAMESLSRLDEITPETKVDEPVNREEETVQAIEDSVQRILQAQLDAIRQEQGEEVEEPTTEMDLIGFTQPRKPDDAGDEEPEDDEQGGFGPLQFGKDYEIK